MRVGVPEIYGAPNLHDIIVELLTGVFWPFGARDDGRARRGGSDATGPARRCGDQGGAAPLVAHAVGWAPNGKEGFVERKTRSQRSRERARLLALVPVLIAVLVFLLVWPRAAAPEWLPEPRPDARALEATRRVDAERARRVEAGGLPADVREVGSLLRRFNDAQALGADMTTLGVIRAELDTRVPEVIARRGPESLLDLRSVQLASFLREVHAFGRSGTPSEELRALGGTFVTRLGAVGWIDKSEVKLPRSALAAAFKLAWNASIGVTDEDTLRPSLDEMRALYAFYLREPHAPEAVRISLETARQGAKTQADCDAIRVAHDRARERWRLKKVEELELIDPAYPAGFARGVVQYRLGAFRESARAFDSWIERNPASPLVTRARAHLLAAMEMSASEP